MKTLSMFLVSVLITISAMSQTAPKDTLRMNLQQCIDYALTNQTTIKNAQLDADISHRQSQEYTGIALPQVNGKFDFADYLKLPTSLIPAEFFGGEPGTFV